MSSSTLARWGARNVETLREGESGWVYSHWIEFDREGRLRILPSTPVHTGRMYFYRSNLCRVSIEQDKLIVTPSHRWTRFGSVPPIGSAYFVDEVRDPGLAASIFSVASWLWVGVIAGLLWVMLVIGLVSIVS